MSCKSSIYMANTNAATVSENSAIPLGSVIRRYGCSVNGTTGGIVLNETGYYLITATITFTAPAAGDATITLQQDGVSVVGATASATVTTATTEINTITVNGIVRVVCGSAPDTITLQNAGIAIDVSNVSITAVKI